MLKLNYVLLVAIDEENRVTVGLTKLKGPASVIKKINFPGGKVEPGESVFQAATREFKEETGVSIHAEDWHIFAVNDQPDFRLTALVALSDKVLYTRTCETEPVWHLDIDAHLRYSQNQPNQYAPGFRQLLTQALSHVAFINEDD